MPQLELERQLLWCLIALKNGLLTPQAIGTAFTRQPVRTAANRIDLFVAQYQVEPSAAQLVQSTANQQVELHAGDLIACLRHLLSDQSLRQNLLTTNSPEISQLIQTIAPAGLESQSDFDTPNNDQYGTIGSQILPEAPAADPFSTGTDFGNSPTARQVDPSSPQPTAEIGRPGAPAAATSISSADEVIPKSAGAAPTTADVLSTHTLVGSEISSESSGNQPTVVPDPDYSTLQSGVTNVIEPGENATLAADDLRAPLRFRVVREHAKGGLGKVSVAEDLELRREVAFKEIQRRFADDTEARTRFIQEAEITGSLEHPGIVPVYGLGTYPDGRPYYAMRFIRGRSLQEAIDDHFTPSEAGEDFSGKQVEFRQLLRRFIDVCNAMDYAHSRTIIHRDLKPGNVMLGDYGETLVVDWGLAKSVTVRGSAFRSALEKLPQSLSGTGSQTIMGAAIGTPQFMSPEQAEGRLNDLSPVSDVYSLGATLYYLLTGKAAFTSRNLLEVLQNVKHGIFPPPIEINPRVPRPLNAICLKAMNRVPALRYSSAKELASDIEKWLADEPVLAYSENRWERLSRWVRRHQARAQAAGVAGVAIAVISVLAAILIDQSRRAEAEALRRLEVANQQEVMARKQETMAKQEALRRSRQTREAVDTMLSGMSDALDAFPGMHDVRKRLLERAAQDYARLAEENNADSELQAESARSLVRLAEVLAKLNSIDKARDALKRADEIFRKQISVAPQATEYRLDLALAYTQSGLLENVAGNPAAAQSQFQKAIDTLGGLGGPPQRDIQYQDALGTALIGLGQAEQLTGKSQDAARHIQQALTLFQVLRKQHPENSHVLTAAAMAESTYARYLLDAGRPNEAIKLYEEAIAIHDELVADFPDEPEYFAQRATARLNLAEALRTTGRWPVVVKNYESCVDDLKEVVRARPDVPRHRENLAKARTNLGQSLRKLGNNTAAVPVLEKALENFDELSASYPLPRYVESIGNTRVSLAQVLSELGQQDAAAALIGTAIEDYRELLDLEPDSASYLEGLGIAQSNRGRILARKGDLPAGIQSFEAAITSLKSAAEKDPETGRISDNLAWAWTHLGYVHLSAGQTPPARDAFQAALQLRVSLVDKFKTSSQYQDSLAWILAGCPVETLRDPKRAQELALQTTQAIPDSPQHWLTLGAADLARGGTAAVLTALNKSRATRGQEDGVTLCLQAIAQIRLKQPDAAQKSWEAAKAWQMVQKPADEELSYWIKQATAAIQGQAP